MIDEETYTFDFSNIILSNELSYDYTLEDETIATIENNVIRKIKLVNLKQLKRIKNLMDME